MSRGKHIVRCPSCGFSFDVSYGRTFACGSCPSIVQCGMAKCPKCGHEFQLPDQPRAVYQKYAQNLR